MDGSIEIAQIESVLQVDTRAENTDSCFWLHRKHDSEINERQLWALIDWFSIAIEKVICSLFCFLTGNLKDKLS